MVALHASRRDMTTLQPPEAGAHVGALGDGVSCGVFLVDDDANAVGWAGLSIAATGRGLYPRVEARI